LRRRSRSWATSSSRVRVVRTDPRQDARSSSALPSLSRDPSPASGSADLEARGPSGPRGYETAGPRHLGPSRPEDHEPKNPKAHETVGPRVRESTCRAHESVEAWRRSDRRLARILTTRRCSQTGPAR
jgi:hypothetical protein